MNIKDFLKYYNQNIPSDFPEASTSSLNSFKAENSRLFSHGEEWDIDKHRKAVMDWLPMYKEVRKYFPYFSFINVIEQDNTFPNDSPKYFRLVEYSKKRGGVQRPLTRYKGNLFVFVETRQKYFFTENMLYWDFLNLNLRNWYKEKINDFNDVRPEEIKQILDFAKKYGVNFIPHSTKVNQLGFSYFAEFLEAWGELKTFQSLLETDPKTPYSKSERKFINGISVQEMQSAIIGRYLSNSKRQPIARDKANFDSIGFNYNPPIALLYEFILKNAKKNLLKRCAYADCQAYFVAKRHDATGCCQQHNKLIRAARYRQKEVLEK